METKELTREEKISRIYEVIADKTISFGTIIAHEGSKYVNLGYEEKCVSWDEDGAPDDFISWVNLIPFDDYERGDCYIRLGYENREDISVTTMRYEDIKSIIGHPVMIGIVF